MLKALLNSGPVQTAIAALLAGYMSLVKHTTRWEVRGRENIEPIWRSGEGVIGCVWHGRILMTIAAWPKTVQPPAILISRSREGDVVTRVAGFHDIGVVRGSSRNRKKTKQKGGLTAFREMDRHVRSGGCMAMTPDGPRGPRMHAGMGAVKLARASGAPLAPLGWTTRWRIVFNSWDRFVLPLPFSRGVIVWGEPVRVARDADAAAIEHARAQLEARLVAANQEAERACGVDVIDPAPMEPNEASPAAEPAS
jgi:lysophospholipid acyltransferase (LPLAT)-like uncharacterized protein